MQNECFRYSLKAICESMMQLLAPTKEPIKMSNRYRPYRRRGIRFFPHIVPIAFPLIFPLGFILAGLVFKVVFAILGVLVIIALAAFIIRAVTLGSSGAAWNSMRNMGNQWQQRNASQQQPPYYQPPQQSPYNQPYGQPTQEQEQQYQQGYQPEQPSYRPPKQPDDYEYNQPQTQYPEQMPPQQ
jgi:hypothetical protein